MNTQQQFRHILDMGVLAPSGDNAQPWQFRVSGNAISVFNLQNADATLYNFRQRGSFLAHGAVVENMLIAGEKLGLRGAVEAFPDGEGSTARVTFAAAQAVDNELYAALPRRATNRKPYEIRPLSQEHRIALFDATTGHHGELRLVEDRDAIEELARAVSLNERLLMENRQLHDFLFSMIRWSPEDERRKAGLYIKTMELPPPLPFLFRFVLRHWFMVRILNLFGLSRSVPAQSAPNYAAASAIGAVVMHGDSDADFFNAGRTVERIWLTATAVGLRFQPITAIPYLAQRVAAGEAGAFTQEHQSIIVEAYGRMSRLFGLQGGEHIAMLFRIGYGDEPTARSAKFPPVMRQ